MKDDSRKKKSKYNKQKYPALNSAYQVANRRELIDYDYLDKLTEEELKWLDSFTAETYITNFQHDGEQLITDDETKRQLYRENNKRNKDIFAVSKGNNKLVFSTKEAVKAIEDVAFTKDQVDPNQEEDYMLTLIALKREAEKLKK